MGIDMVKMRCELLKVEGAFNVRDIGGYVAVSGAQVRKRRFIRADSLSGLTARGKDDILGLGVRCVVDLRSDAEMTRQPDAIASHPQVDYHHIPMLDYIQSSMVSGDFTSFPTSMAGMYTGLLDSAQAQLLRVFQVLADPARERVLFHCTAGKDRTGVVAMLLLSLAGVDDDTIAEDYSWSELLLPPMMSGGFSHSPDVPGYLARSSPESMLAALGHLHEVYGGARTYLQKIGLSAGELDQLLHKLIA